MTETIIPTFASVARRVWYWTVVRGVLAIIFGVIALAAPISTAVSLAVVVAIFAVADGIFEIIDGIRHRGYSGAGLRVLQGALTLAFGVVLVAWPEITTLAIIWTIAVWAVVVGVIQVVVALSLRTVAGSGWGWGVVSGLVSVIFGGLVLARPAAGLVSIIWVLGVYAIMLGVLLVGFGLQVRRVGTQVGALAQGRGAASTERAARADRAARAEGADRTEGAESTEGADGADGGVAGRDARADRTPAHLAPAGQPTPDADRAAAHVPGHLQGPTEPARTGTEPAQPEPAETEPAQPEPAETEPAQPEPAETEPAQPDQTREGAQTEPSQPEPAQPDQTRGLAETEPAQPDQTGGPAETEPAPSDQTREGGRSASSPS